MADIDTSAQQVEKLRETLERLPLEINDEMCEKLLLFYSMLIEKNKVMNLTAITQYEEVLEKHFLDSLSLINVCDPTGKRILDLGTGAGFPGIPLKIVNPSIRLTLCEPRPNRINFLNMVIEKMGLKGIDVFGHKVTSRSMTIPVDGVISRAFELMEKTLPRIANSLKVGGRVFFMKGPAVADELKTFHPEDFGYKIVGKHFYTIPNSTQERALIILERVE